MARRIYQFKSRPIQRGLEAARAAGVKRPAFRAGAYTVALGAADGALYATRAGAYLGRIEPGGAYRAARLASRADVETLRLIAEKPLEVAAAAARATFLSSDGGPARCACCGRKLGESDLSVGIGAKCLEVWKLKQRKEKVNGS